MQAAARLDADIAQHRLGERVEVLGGVASEKLDQLYTNTDLFVLASRFEGYGMAYSEAIAHGVPVVGTNAGAIPDTVPTGAGILVAPDDAGELARVLRRLIENPAERRSLAEGARRAAAQFPAWPDTATIIACALEGLA